MLEKFKTHHLDFVKQAETIAAFTLGLDLTECEDSQKRQESISQDTEVKQQVEELISLHERWCEYKENLPYGPMTEEYIDKLTGIDNAKAEFCNNMQKIRQRGRGGT